MKMKLSKVLTSLALCFVLGGTFAACKGEAGATGATGATGAQGEAGKSAYQTWLDQGHTGTEADFLDWLKGEDGVATNGVTPKLQINEETNEWEVSYDNGQTWTSLGVKATGDKGEDGEQGPAGPAGTTCAHANGFYTYEMVAATCVATGEALYVCKDDCGFAKVDEIAIDPENHAEYKKVVVEPTCTKDGYSYEECVCGAFDPEQKTEPTEALGHDYVVVGYSCETNGKLDCARCDYEVPADEEDETVYTARYANFDRLVALIKLKADYDNMSAAEKATFDEFIAEIEEFEITPAELVATGHSDFENDVYVRLMVVNNNGNICEDGGQWLKVCKYCAERSYFFPDCMDCEGMIFEAVEIPAEGHAVAADWTVKTAPTTTTAGVITGYCEVCDTTAEVEIPAISAENIANGTYTLTTGTKAPTCTEAGKNVYKITVKDWSDTFEVVTTASHNYNGTALDENKVYTVSEIETIFDIEDWATAEESELDAKGLTRFDNYGATCVDESGKAGFTCTDCKKNYLVDLIGNHTYTENDLVEGKQKAATCCEAGYATYLCSVCEEEVEITLPKNEHKYKVTASEPVNGIITLTFTCETCALGCACGNEAVYTVECTTWEISTDPTKTYAATCKAAGKKTYVYTYVDDGATERGEFVEILPQLKHNYNHKEIDYANKVYEIGELSEIFGIDLSKPENEAQWEALGFKLYASDLATCEVEGKVSFVCTDCEKSFLVNMIGNHKWELLEEGHTTAATCTTNEIKHYVCSVCEDTNDVETEGTLLGHLPQLISTNEQLEEGILVFKCTREGCTYVTDPIEAADWYIDEYPKPTCNSLGEKVLFYKVSADETAYRRIKLGDIGYTDHWFDNNGVITYIDLDRETPYTIGELSLIFGIDLKTATDEQLDDLGITVFVNEKATCKVTGSVGFTCSNCKNNQLISGVTGDHDWTWTDEDVHAVTCTTDGYTTKTCSVCDKTFDDVDQKATGHYITFVGENRPHITKYPTTTEAGEATMSCSRCGEKVTAVLPAITAETIADGTYTKIDAESQEAACNRSGYITYSFKVSLLFENGAGYNGNGKVKVIVVSADHDFEVEGYDEPLVFVWVKDGYKYTGYLCKDCGQVIVQNVEEVPEEVPAE